VGAKFFLCIHFFFGKKGMYGGALAPKQNLKVHFESFLLAGKDYAMLKRFQHDEFGSYDLLRLPRFARNCTCQVIRLHSGIKSIGNFPSSP